MDEAKKRDYKAEYKKFQSSTKMKKYRAELNKYNRQKGTYGNGDKKDASHKGGKIVGFENQSKNRGRAEKSRLKKENKIVESLWNYIKEGDELQRWKVYIKGEKKPLILTGKDKNSVKKFAHQMIHNNKVKIVKVVKEGILKESFQKRHFLNLIKQEIDSLKGQIAYSNDKVNYKGTPDWEKKEFKAVLKDLKKKLKDTEKHYKRVEKLKEGLELTEASSRVKRQIKNIMKYDHIDDLEEYLETFDIDKKHWKVISHYFDAIRDENMGIKPKGSADKSKKELQKVLFKAIKEGLELTESKQKYVVGLTSGDVISGDKAVSEKKALQIMSRIARQSDGWVNPFMIGVEYWNGTHPKRKGKPHKANKKKIMVKEGKLDELGFTSNIDLGGNFEPHPQRKQDVSNQGVYLQGFSNKEAKNIIDGNLKNWVKSLRKVEHQVIKDWMNGAKRGQIDFFDIIRGLKTGDIKRAHPFEVEFLTKILNRNKIIDRFRSYFKGKKGKPGRTK